MNSRTMILRLYSLLLRAYPARLREEFGRDMLQLFADQLSHARERRQAAGLYMRTLFDWLRTVPVEHHSEYRRRAASDSAVLPIARLLRRGLILAPNPSAALVITAGVLVWRGVCRFQRRPRG